MATEGQQVEDEELEELEELDAVDEKPAETTESRTMAKARNPPPRPPRLMLDDGSRVMMENADSMESTRVATQGESASFSIRPSDVSISEFYELDRLATEIKQQMDLLSAADKHKDDFSCRVALQFSPHLLPDGPEVSWLLEDAIVQEGMNTSKPPLVFLLGDSTGSPCCPNEVGAAHLEADVLVQFGPDSCLSPPGSIPVLYAFASNPPPDPNEVQSCAQAILEQCRQEQKPSLPIKLLLLFDLRYYSQWHTSLVQLLHSDAEGLLEDVLVGLAPRGSQTATCQRDEEPILKETGVMPSQRAIVLGGLRLPDSVQRLSDFTCVYIGCTDSNDDSNHFLNTYLHWSSECHAEASSSFVSGECSATPAFWSFNVPTKSLETSVESSSLISRFLRRRFYLSQKARLASTFGILVGTLSQAERFQRVVHQLQAQIRAAGKTCYLLAVGKVTPTKCANFSHVDAFVLVSCPQTCVPDDEREYAVPVLTPWELSVALGETEWGPQAYGRGSFDNFGNHSTEHSIQGGDDNPKDSGSDDHDRPFFSIVSGTYVSSLSLSSPPPPTGDGVVDDARGEKSALTAGAGEQRLTTYQSAAAEHWKQREYRGLDSQIGETQVRPAVPGRVGIASNYSSV